MKQRVIIWSILHMSDIKLFIKRGARSALKIIYFTVLKRFSAYCIWGLSLALKSVSNKGCALSSALVREFKSIKPNVGYTDTLTMPKFWLFLQLLLFSGRKVKCLFSFFLYCERKKKSDFPTPGQIFVRNTIREFHLILNYTTPLPTLLNYIKDNSSFIYSNLMKTPSVYLIS